QLEFQERRRRGLSTRDQPNSPALRCRAAHPDSVRPGKQQSVSVRRSPDDLQADGRLCTARCEAADASVSRHPVQFVRLPAPTREADPMNRRSGQLLTLILAGTCAALFLLALAFEFGVGRGYSWLSADGGAPALAGTGAVDRSSFKLPPQSDFAVTYERPL